jgi:hypothetical protein
VPACAHDRMACRASSQPQLAHATRDSLQQSPEGWRSYPWLAVMGHRIGVGTGLEGRTVALGALALALAVALGWVGGALGGALGGAVGAVAGLVAPAVLAVALELRSRKVAAASKRHKFEPPRSWVDRGDEP